MSFVLDNLQADCDSHGHGRKKWWATQLCIPQLTISHWLAGRQHPNGFHALTIQEILSRDNSDQEANQWLQALTKMHYQGGLSSAKPILNLAIPKIMQAASLDSRTYGFLSFVVAQEKIDFSPSSDAKLTNRLGWLLAVSGRPAAFPVNCQVGIQRLLPLPATPAFCTYLKSRQTAHGKKWRVLDCDLTDIKASFI